MLWTGNNENIWGWHDWDWQAALAGRTWGRGYYLDVLPRIVGDLDPTRPYWPGSPWSGTETIHPTTRRTAPPTSGTCGTPTTTPNTGSTCRASSPSSATRPHPRTPRCAGR
ncbi:hypothetical protein NKG94_26430 [Micromonospora sp. M12]